MMRKMALISAMLVFLFFVPAVSEEAEDEVSETVLGQAVSEFAETPEGVQKPEAEPLVFTPDEENMRYSAVEEESSPAPREESEAVVMMIESAAEAAESGSKTDGTEAASKVPAPADIVEMPELEVTAASEVQRQEEGAGVSPPEWEDRAVPEEEGAEVPQSETEGTEALQPGAEGETAEVNLPEADELSDSEKGTVAETNAKLTSEEETEAALPADEETDSEEEAAGEQGAASAETVNSAVTEITTEAKNSSDPLADLLAPSAEPTETAEAGSTRNGGEPEVIAVENDALLTAGGSSGTEGYIIRLYRTVFNRNPDAAGLKYWVDSLETGTRTAASVVDFFFNSSEYINSGKTNDQIVRDIYGTMLDRMPDSAGFAYWKKYLDIGMTPESLLAGFVNSPEFTSLAQNYGISRGEIVLTDPLDKSFERTYFVYRLYENCLGRTPDLGGERYWCQRLDEGETGSTTAANFFFSDEFSRKRYNNSTFVEYLYKAIHGRKSDLNGLIFWTTKLNYTDTREKVMNGFIDSQEFRNQCTAAQISPGNPISTPDDTLQWQYNIAVLSLCNQYRREAGLKDLYTREDLYFDVALARARESAVQFAHTRPDGTSCFTLFKQQGFYGHLGENLAAGSVYADPAKIVEAWMNSEGHRKNIMNEDFTYLATGYFNDPSAKTYCPEGKYAGQYVRFQVYGAQAFCNYGYEIN